MENKLRQVWDLIEKQTWDQVQYKPIEWTTYPSEHVNKIHGPIFNQILSLIWDQVRDQVYEDIDGMLSL